MYFDLSEQYYNIRRIFFVKLPEFCLVYKVVKPDGKKNKN